MRIDGVIIFHLSKRFLYTVLCNISGGPVGEIWIWSLLIVKELSLNYFETPALIRNTPSLLPVRPALWTTYARSVWPSPFSDPDPTSYSHTVLVKVFGVVENLFTTTSPNSTTKVTISNADMPPPPPTQWCLNWNTSNQYCMKEKGPLRVSHILTGEQASNVWLRFSISVCSSSLYLLLTTLAVQGRELLAFPLGGRLVALNWHQ